MERARAKSDAPPHGERSALCGITGCDASGHPAAPLLGGFLSPDRPLFDGGELSLTLGAVPFHRERGADPRGAGAQAVLAALQHCMLMGFYDAVLDLAHRSYALLDWATDPEECWRVTSKLTMALAAMGRPDEAAAL